MPQLSILSGSHAGRVIELKPGVNRIGRSPESDIFVSEPSISGSHCELHVAPIATSVQDLNSTNGTFINRQRVSKGVLQTGDVLTLGDIDFSVAIEEVNVALPEIPVQEAQGAAFLEDGTPACFSHRNVPALFICTKCENWWCGECVRTLKRISGEFLKFCPECSGPCATMQQPKTTSRKASFFGRIGDTLRLPRKK